MLIDIPDRDMPEETRERIRAGQLVLASVVFLHRDGMTTITVKGNEAHSAYLGAALSRTSRNLLTYMDQLERDLSATELAYLRAGATLAERIGTTESYGVTRGGLP